MRRLAFATYRQSPEVTDDDQLAAQALSGREVEVEAAVWDDPSVDWDRFDRVVVRSTWDFHLKSDLYARWIRKFLDRPGQLWNPPSVILGNLDKRYLIDLARQGIEVVPTVSAKAGDKESLVRIIERHAWQDVVVKPAVSASARGTWRASRTTAHDDQERFAAQILEQDLLVQPFCPEVASNGEWSLVFLDGEFSHGVLKRPADGDFRVQRHFGGHPTAAVPSARLVEQAAGILTTLGERLLYARVDGFERDGDFVLMELELNEPYLFLSLSPGAASRFADAVLRILDA